jgi:hypothetical protein
VDNDFSTLEIVVERLAIDAAIEDPVQGHEPGVSESTRSAEAQSPESSSPAESVSGGSSPVTPPAWLRRATLQFEQKGPHDED